MKLIVTNSTQSFGMRQSWFIIIACLFLILPKSVARHIVGGDVVYNCVNLDTINNVVTFDIIFTLYRDAFGGGAGFDTDAMFGVFRGSGNNWTHFRSVENQRASNIRIVDNVAVSPCLRFPPNIRVEQGIYRFEVTLPLSNQTYLIAYQRCCRNNTINNIIEPDHTGAAFTAEITPLAQRTCNNSPKFDNFPPIVICLGERLTFDHSASDIEGDQLVYEFCAPLQAGGQDGVSGGDPRSCNGVIPDPRRCPPPYREVVFRQPTFSATNPLGGDPQITIDSETGFITGIPTTLGQFVVGVCVKEFRNGELISAIRRDFQFNVAQCDQDVIADIESDQYVNGERHLINSCGESTITFINRSRQAQNIFSYLWRFTIDGREETRDTRDATITFPGVGLYTGTMVVNQGTECADSADISVNVFPSIEADFIYDYDTCIAGPVTFTDLSESGAGPIIERFWTFGDDGVSTERNPLYQYGFPGVYPVRLSVKDNNECRDSIVRNLPWQPVPNLIVVEPTTFIGCKPANIFFNNLSFPVDSTYDIQWTFGDGNTSNEISPNHTYNEEGIYSVRVRITSPAGCTVERFYPSWIRVEPSPTANFSFSPEQPSAFNREVVFTDLSIGAISWQWNFSNISSSLQRNPTFTFPDTGLYRIEQVVLNERACTDTMVQFIDVTPLSTLHFPNAFTPNNDGLNDEFKGRGFFDGIRNYRMVVYSRWGEQLFASSDPRIGWNGRKNNSGDELPPGVYVYAISYIGPRGETNTEKGHVTLIR
ncbi:MAG TPA: PKD domain-containing protein [Saprospiraceae bacterium]|nr:PKD domain-containing protein [Saprospiraceae bacterium]